MINNNDELLRTINEILQRENDVQIQRKKDGYVVLEVSRVIRMANKCSSQNGENMIEYP